MTGSKPAALPLGYSPKWGDRWGSNPRMPEPQSGALTTSPRPPYYGRGSRDRTRIKGFGDLRFAIKLYPYYTMVEGERFELPNPEGADLQSAAFSHFATPPSMRKQKRRWLETESNRRHKVFQTFALPTELSSLYVFITQNE